MTALATLRIGTIIDTFSFSGTIPCNNNSCKIGFYRHIKNSLVKYQGSLYSTCISWNEVKDVNKIIIL